MVQWSARVDHMWSTHVARCAPERLCYGRRRTVHYHTKIVTRMADRERGRQFAAPPAMSARMERRMSSKHKVSAIYATSCAGMRQS